MTQLITDHYYSLMPYISTEAKIILVTIIALCSKYCDNKIVFPHQLAYIFNMELSRIQHFEEVIICALDFDLAFPNYANDLNVYLHKWKQIHDFSFFRDDIHSYRGLCIAHAILERIYEKKHTILENDICFAIKYALK